MIDQRLRIDIVFILNLSRMKSVYVVFYTIPSQTVNVIKIQIEWNGLILQFLFDVLCCQRDAMKGYLGVGSLGA